MSSDRKIAITPVAGEIYKLSEEPPRTYLLWTFQKEPEKIMAEIAYTELFQHDNVNLIALEVNNEYLVFYTRLLSFDGESLVVVFDGKAVKITSKITSIRLYEGRLDKDEKNQAVFYDSESDSFPISLLLNMSFYKAENSWISLNPKNIKKSEVTCTYNSVTCKLDFSFNAILMDNSVETFPLGTIQLPSAYATLVLQKLKNNEDISNVKQYLLRYIMGDSSLESEEEDVYTVLNEMKMSKLIISPTF